MEARIPPQTLWLDDAKVTIVEVMRSDLITGDTFYHVFLQVEMPPFPPRRFSLDVKSFDELRKKLLVEVSKLKIFRICGMEDLVK